jgi:hypothetical protein
MFGNAPPRIIFNDDVFKQFLLQWIVAHDISFRMCEDAFFRRLCAYLAACQPDYSSVKITLTDRRCRMGDDAIEALECLKSWQRDGLIAATKQDIKVIEDMWNALCEEDLA